MWRRASWLALVLVGCVAELPCGDPVFTRRHVLVSSRDHRFKSFASRFDNVVLLLENEQLSDFQDGNWTMDISYETISCLTAGEDPMSSFDEIDEDLLAEEAAAGDGYALYDGVGWFKLHARPIYWKFAAEVCRREGGRLAVPDTEDKAMALLDVLQKHSEVIQSSVLTGQVLIGVNDMEEEGLFRSSTGEEFRPWDDALWFANEPDDAEPGEDCVTFHASGRIRDVPCYFELPFVCEKQHV